MPQTTSVALFDCPHCIDEFAFDYQKIAQLTYGWRVRVRCPGCGNIVVVVMLAYTLIHGCDPNKYKQGETVEILTPDPNPSAEWRMAVNKLRMEILQKKTGWREPSYSSSNVRRLGFVLVSIDLATSNPDKLSVVPGKGDLKCEVLFQAG